MLDAHLKSTCHAAAPVRCFTDWLHRHGYRPATLDTTVRSRVGWTELAAHGRVLRGKGRVPEGTSGANPSRHQPKVPDPLRRSQRRTRGKPRDAHARDILTNVRRRIRRFPPQHLQGAYTDADGSRM